MSTEPLLQPSDTVSAFRQCGGEPARIFEELPKASIVSVSRPETGEISPILLSYTIELQYKQFKWRLRKKASQVLYLQFALRKRAIIEEFHDKQGQVKEWLYSLGIVDQTVMMQDDEEPDDGSVPTHHEDSVSNRYVPSVAALSIIRPSLGGQQSVADRAKIAMQNYLDLFLGNLEIVNSREVCKFLEVSKLSFLQEYGPKLREGYVTVKHLSNISLDSDVTCFPCHWFHFCDNNWKKVWAVLKPGFLALLEDPFNNKPLDIVMFDVLPSSTGKGETKIYLAEPVKERNPLRYTFKVTGGNRSIFLRTISSAKVKTWVTAINEAGLRPMEGWCSPHRFGSFAPVRGLTVDGSQAQWYVDGKAAFEAIASSIQDAKSEIFITGWWLCPELYMRRPFDSFPTFRLDSLLEEKAKQGVQIYVLLYKEVSIALKINSLYSMRRLLKIHENVRVLRYPDHFASRVYLWSHHEKLVVIDYKVCFLGGLDLCFGRYDTPEHQVGDCPSVIWPGKDYYNPRESEPNSWEDTMRDELDRHKYPRMPWHDVHCALWGPACRDIARHFVQRWNHAKRTKAPNEHEIPLLMPHHHMVIPHYMGRSKEIDIDNKKDEDDKKEIERQDSFSSQSPLQDIPLLLPQEADGAVTSSEDDRNSSESSPLLSQTLDGETLVSDNQKKGLQDEAVAFNLEDQCIVNAVDDWWEKPEGTNDATSLEYGQVGPRTTCHCQVIRSVSQWSVGTSHPEESIHTAYCSLIEKAKHFIYIELRIFRFVTMVRPTGFDEEPVMDDVWTMKKQLPDFMGTNPVGWITAAETFFEKNKIHPSHMLQWAFMSMEGEEAMLWFYSWTQDNINADWKSFSIALIIRFGFQMKKIVLENPETQANVWMETKIRVKPVIEVVETSVKGNDETNNNESMTEFDEATKKIEADCTRVSVTKNHTMVVDTPPPLDLPVKVFPEPKPPDRDASWYEDVISTKLPPDPSELPSDSLELQHSDSVVTVPPQPKPPDPDLLIVVGVINQAWNTGISVRPRSEESLWKGIMDESPWEQTSRKAIQLKENLRKRHVDCSYIAPPPKPPDEELLPTTVEAPLVKTGAVVVEGSPWFADLRKGDKGVISTICKLNNFLILLGQAQIDLNDWVQEQKQWRLYSCLLKLILELMCQTQLEVRELELIFKLTCQTQIKAKKIAQTQFEFVAASSKRKILVSFTRMSTLMHVTMKKGFVLILIPNHSFDILMDTHAAMELSKPYVVVSIGVGNSTTLHKIDCCCPQHKIKVMVNAYDTFQLGVVKQLLTHALSLQTLMLAKHYENDHVVVAKEASLVDSNMFLFDTPSHLQNEPLLRTMSKWICFNLVLVSFVGETLVCKDAFDQHSLVSIELKRMQTVDFGFLLIGEDMINESLIKVKYCDTYMFHYPSHYGVECLDHWCPWVSQCIKSKNTRIFWFISSVTILCTYVCSTSIFYIKVLRYCYYWKVRKVMKESCATDMLVIAINGMKRKRDIVSSLLFFLIDFFFMEDISSCLTMLLENAITNVFVMLIVESNCNMLNFVYDRGKLCEILFDAGNYKLEVITQSLQICKKWLPFGLMRQDPGELSLPIAATKTTCDYCWSWSGLLIFHELLLNFVFDRGKILMDTNFNLEDKVVLKGWVLIGT